MTSEILFHMDLKHSNSVETEQLVERIHRTTFPFLITALKVDDITEQMRGIDRKLHFIDRVVTVEEKLDDTPYPNLAFEWTQGSGAPGWAQKDLEAELFVYIKRNQRRAYYFHTENLLSWVRENFETLEQEYKLRRVGISGASVLPVPLKRLQREVWHRVTEF
jgi:hypothetical protein